jgi:1-acyl-sn-glycerol-3-phosphate acyltransferase
VIPAAKSRAFSWWFAGNTERRIRRTFSRVLAHGVDGLARELARRPVLVVSNHTSWWDPLVVLLLGQRVLGADTFALMDATNLRRLPFFRKVGAFGVDLGDPRDGARAVRHGAALLDRPGRLVWIFPQGRERPVTARPLGFQAGSAAIARLAPGASVVPIGLRYELAGEPEPQLFVSCGPPIAETGSRLARVAAHEQGVARELERIDTALVRGEARGFQLLHQRRVGLFDGVATALLVRWSRLALPPPPP